MATNEYDDIMLLLTRDPMAHHQSQALAHPCTSVS